MSSASPRRRNTNRPARPEMQCGNAQLPASPDDGLAGYGQRTFDGRLRRIDEKYPPVLTPQLGHDVVDRLAGLRVDGGSQMGIDGGSGGRSMPKIPLDDPQVDTRFQKMGGV